MGNPSPEYLAGYDAHLTRRGMPSDISADANRARRYLTGAARAQAVKSGDARCIVCKGGHAMTPACLATAPGVETPPAPPSLGDQLKILIAAGLTIGEAMKLFGEHQEAERPEVAAFAQAVRDAAPAAMRGSYDGFDVDAVPIVSESEEGAYVSVWVWVSNEDAGIESDEGDDDDAADCEGEACATGHPAKKADLNAEGFCPTCAEPKAE